MMEDPGPVCRTSLDAISDSPHSSLRQNEFTTGSPAGSVNFGIFVTAAAENTKLIRNTFEGEFSQEMVDQGEETKLPDPFDPES